VLGNAKERKFESWCLVFWIRANRESVKCENHKWSESVSRHSDSYCISTHTNSSRDIEYGWVEWTRRLLCVDARMGRVNYNRFSCITLVQFCGLKRLSTQKQSPTILIEDSSPHSIPVNVEAIPRGAQAYRSICVVPRANRTRRVTKEQTKANRGTQSFKALHFDSKPAPRFRTVQHMSDVSWICVNNLSREDSNHGYIAPHLFSNSLLHARNWWWRRTNESED
jgi:hypothetical protein